MRAICSRIYLSLGERMAQIRPFGASDANSYNKRATDIYRI